MIFKLLDCQTELVEGDSISLLRLRQTNVTYDEKMGLNTKENLY